MNMWCNVPVLTGTTPVLDSNTVSGLMDQLGMWLLNLGKNLLVALIIFMIGKKLIKMLNKLVNRSLEKANIEVGASKFLKTVINVVLYAVLLFMVASQVGINTASIITVLGTASLAFSLALQGSLSNFAGGVLILLTRPFRVGDYISCGEGEGTVESIGLVYTTLNTVDNKVITIPNGTISNISVTNVTAEEERRVDISVGISYKADIKKAKEVMEQVYREHPSVLPEKGITVYVDSLGDSAVVLGGRGWVKAEDYWQSKWDITESIKLRFDEAGIEIPFNQLDVHMIQ